MRGARFRQRCDQFLTALLILNILFIWGNSLLPPEASWKVSNAVKNVLLALMPGSTESGGGAGSLGALIRKIAHFTEFCVLGILLRCRWRDLRQGLERTLLAALLTAAVDETIQVFTNRTSSVFDVWIDFSGAVIGSVLVFWIIRYIVDKKRAR